MTTGMTTGASPGVPCPSCGSPLGPDADRCSACGATVLLVGTGAPTTTAAWGRRDVRARRREADAPVLPGPGTVAAAGPTAPDAPALPALRGAAAGTGQDGTGLGPAFDGVGPAPAARRLVAVTVDLVAVAAVAVVAGALSSSVLLGGVVGAEMAAALVLWEARSGRTAGNLLLGLRTAQVETPWAPGLGRAATRAAIVAASLLTVVGPWVLVGTAAGDRSRRGQGWHDRAARCVVVDVRAMRVDRAAASVAPAASGASAAPGASVAPGASGVSGVARPAAVAAPAEQRLPGPPASVPPAPTSRPGPAEMPLEAPALAPQGRREARAAAEQPDGRTTQGPVPQVAPAPPATVTYVVVVDSGETMSVTGPGLIGRRPQPRDGERCDHVIALEDVSRTLSRTHARFGVDGSGFWIEDGGSANGTAVVAPDGSRVDLVPGERAVVPDGGTVHLGRRTITVHRLA